MIETKSTFTIYATPYRAPFRVGKRPAGDFKVDRLNVATGSIERWGTYTHEWEARAACASVNREIARMEARA
jgi:hypothetical protein